MSTPQVVFACRKNGGRSVISRVLTEHYAGHRIVALSAGTEPGEHVHPEVVRVLEDLGLDTSRETPKPLTRDMIATSDLAVTGRVRALLVEMLPGFDLPPSVL